MNRLNSIRIVAVAAAAMTILGLAQPAFAQQPVPFQGRADIIVTDAVIVPPSTQILTGSATGVSNHLGLFTRTETVIVDLNTFTFTSKKIVFTAANGDQLYADAVGGFTSKTTAAGTYTFTGGTGRFLNATGGAVFAATAIKGGFAVTFVGTINY